MKYLFALMIVVVVLGCKKKEPPKPPQSAQLVFPEKNSECTTGQDINTTTSQVEFRWQSSNDTETYELRATNLNSNTTQTITTSSTSAKLPLEKGAPFSWAVVSKNSQVLETASSATWSFYNSGFETAYAPFPAEIEAPKMGATVFKDINNEVELSWVGADLDEDIDGYDIYLSTENPPETLLFSAGVNAASRKVSVAANTVYFWRIITKDKEGNSSDSGIFEFRAL